MKLNNQILLQYQLKNHAVCVNNEIHFQIYLHLAEESYQPSPPYLQTDNHIKHGSDVSFCINYLHNVVIQVVRPTIWACGCKLLTGLCEICHKYVMSRLF